MLLDAEMDGSLVQYTHIKKTNRTYLTCITTTTAATSTTSAAAATHDERTLYNNSDLTRLGQVLKKVHLSRQYSTEISMNLLNK